VRHPQDAPRGKEKAESYIFTRRDQRAKKGSAVCLEAGGKNSPGRPVGEGGSRRGEGSAKKKRAVEGTSR